MLMKTYKGDKGRVGNDGVPREALPFVSGLELEGDKDMIIF